MIAPEPDDPQEAFRAGLGALPSGRAGAGPGLGDAGARWPGGPNESMMVATPRLSGLGDVRGAWETGRVLRRIAQLLDQAGAPEAVGRQFRDNVAAALMVQRTRKRGTPWDGAATVDMFMEVYGRVLGFDDAAFAAVRSALLAVTRRP
ncbi:MAG: hypothetical protein U1E14_09135 [Geminicoccaceae bacterium]